MALILARYRSDFQLRNEPVHEDLFDLILFAVEDALGAGVSLENRGRYLLQLRVRTDYRLLLLFDKVVDAVCRVEFCLRLQWPYARVVVPGLLFAFLKLLLVIFAFVIVELCREFFFFRLQSVS
jgi:hypothetical protein